MYSSDGVYREFRVKCREICSGRYSESIEGSVERDVVGSVEGGVEGDVM